MIHWWLRAINAEEDNEYLQREIDKRNSASDHETGAENMEMKFRVVDMTRALEALTGSTDGATAAEILGGRHELQVSRRIRKLVGGRVKKLYDRHWGEGAFDEIGYRRVRDLEREGMLNSPRRYSEDDEDA